MERSRLISRYLIDTYALYWHLTEPSKLSDAVQQIFEEAYRGNCTLIVSPIVLLELYAVIRKWSASVDFEAELAHLGQEPYQIEPISVDDLRLLDRLIAIPELHDRLINATAVRLGILVVTKDATIRAAAVVESIW